MVNTIIIKNDSNTGNSPASNEIVTGELAINTTDGKLFYGDASGNPQEFTASVSGNTFGGSSFKIGRDADNLLDFSTDNEITFRVSAGDGIVMKASGEIEATKFDGALEGNADTATALATSRNFRTNLASTSTAGFTGAANCTPGVTGTLAVGNGGTGVTSMTNLKNALDDETWTFANNVTLAGFVLDGNTITGVNDSGEFDDDDSHIMTSAGVNDRIQAFGYTTNTGTVTSVGLNPGDGLDAGSAITSSGTISISLDLSELADGTADIDSNDEVIYLDNGTEKRKAFSELKLSQFNNDAGFITSGFDTAGTGLTSSGTTVNVIGGTGITANANDIQITNGGVDTTQLADDAVTTAKINDGDVTNAKLAGSIDDSKLSTITTTNKVHVAALDIDGATDIGEALADADLFIVDNGANSTERKATMSRLKTYMQDNLAFTNNDGDITGVTAGDGLTGGGTSGGVTLAVGVDDSSIEINSDALRVKASGITNAMLAGSIATSKIGSGTFADARIASSNVTQHSGDITSLGTLTSLTVDHITIDGSTITDSGTLDFNIGGDLTFDVDGSDIHFKDDGQERFHFKLDADPTLEVTGVFDIDCSNDIILDTGVDDIIFKYAGTTAITFDLSANPDMDIVGDFKIDGGGEIELESDNNADIVLDSAGDIILDYADGDSIIFRHDSANDMLDISGTGSGNDVTVQLMQNGGDLIFKQFDGTEVARVEDGGLFDVVSNKLAINGTAITATAAELNIMDGVTSTAAELNVLDGISSVDTDLSSVSGSDNTLASAKAIKAYVDANAGGGGSTGNFSFSGNTMSNSNDILIDGNGDITLDANGADIFFHDNTTKFGTIRNEGGGLDIHGGNQTSIKAIVTDSAGKYTTASNWIFTVTAGITNVGTSSLEKLVSFNTTNGNTVDNGGGGDPGDHFYNQTFLVPVDCDLIHVYGSFNEAISNQNNMTEFTLSVCDNGSVDFADKYKITEQADETGATSFGNLGMIQPGVMMDFLADAGHRVDTGSAGAQSFTAGQKISGGLKVNSNVASGGTRGNWTFVFRTTGGLS